MLERASTSFASFLHALFTSATNTAETFYRMLANAALAARLRAIEAAYHVWASRGLLACRGVIVSVAHTTLRGMALITGVIVFIAVGAAITIGYIVNVSIVNNASAAAGTLTSSQSVQLTNIGSNVINSFLLLTVLPVVVGAGIILGALFLFMHFGT